MLEPLRFMCGNLGLDRLTHHGPCLFIDADRLQETFQLAESFEQVSLSLQPLPGLPNVYDGRGLRILLHRYGPGPQHWVFHLGTADAFSRTGTSGTGVHYVAHNACTCDRCVHDFLAQTEAHGGFAFTVQSMDSPEMAAPFKIGIPARNVFVWDTTGPQRLPVSLKGVPVFE